MRDMIEYSKKYVEHNFEEYKVVYRRKKILEAIEKYSPQKVLEIGCGADPLFQYASGVEFTVVEASEEFYANAQKLAAGKAGINCILGFFEEITDKLSEDYDMVICASLLHEVEKPERLLQAIASVCKVETIVHISVPNANSMHRLLGREIGILSDVHDKTESNVMLQQNNVFDIQMLKKIVEENKFNVIESGSFFVKPFSHAQMYKMLQMEILNEAVIEGLYRLGECMPDFGSEIYVNCKLKKD